MSTRFLRLGLALVVVSATVGMFVVHFQPMMVDAGMTAAGAASAAFVIGPMMILGRVGTGLLFDRFSAPLVAAVAFALPLVACLVLLSFDGSIAMALLAAAIVGAGTGAEADVVAFLASRYFGLKNYGVIYGLLMGIYGIGIGAGASLAGLTFDRTGSYELLLIALGAGCGLASLLAVTLGSRGFQTVGKDATEALGSGQPAG